MVAINGKGNPVFGKAATNATEKPITYIATEIA